jgi:hypothetical protein
MVGQPKPTMDTSGFLINVVNEGTTDDTIFGITFVESPAESVYMQSLAIDTLSPHPGYPLWPPQKGIYQGKTATVNPGYAVPPNMSKQVEISFLDFRVDSTFADTTRSYIHGKTFRFRFSDGSEITVTP